jgi:hypothetical protein
VTNAHMPNEQHNQKNMYIFFDNTYILYSRRITTTMKRKKKFKALFHMPSKAYSSFCWVRTLQLNLIFTTCRTQQKKNKNSFRIFRQWEERSTKKFAHYLQRTLTIAELLLLPLNLCVCFFFLQTSSNFYSSDSFKP